MQNCIRRHLAVADNHVHTEEVPAADARVRSRRCASTMVRATLAHPCGPGAASGGVCAAKRPHIS